MSQTWTSIRSFGTKKAEFTELVLRSALAQRRVSVSVMVVVVAVIGVVVLATKRRAGSGGRTSTMLPLHSLLSQLAQRLWLAPRRLQQCCESDLQDENEEGTVVRSEDLVLGGNAAMMPCAFPSYLRSCIRVASRKIRTQEGPSSDNVACADQTDEEAVKMMINRIRRRRC